MCVNRRMDYLSIGNSVLKSLNRYYTNIIIICHYFEYDFFVYLDCVYCNIGAGILLLLLRNGITEYRL